MSLCEVNCDYNGYNSEIKKAKCECQVKIKLPLLPEIIYNKDRLINNFIDIKNSTNFKVMKCTNLLFTKEGLKNNIGSYSTLLVILIILINNILFVFKGFKILCEIIDTFSENKENIINGTNYIIENNKKIEIKKIGKDDTIINLDNLNNNNENKIDKNSKNSNKKKPPKRINILKTNDDEMTGKTSELKIIKSQNLINDDKKGIINSNILQNIYINNNYTDYEYNSLTYKEALKVDKRTYSQLYLSLLRKRNTLIFTFYTKNDYNSRFLKISIFFFSFDLNFTINAFFFNDANIHKIYLDQGNFNFIYQIPQILYSLIISIIINAIITTLSLSEKNILSIKKKEGTKREKISKIKKLLVIKFIILFILLYSLCLFFWYYLSSFCAVYKNTQIYLTKDTIIGFCLSFIYPLFICLIPGIFRIISLKKDNREYLYKISQIIQLL